MSASTWLVRAVASALRSTARQNAYFSPLAQSTAQRTFSHTLMLWEDVRHLEGARKAEAIDEEGRQAADDLPR